MAQNFYIVLGVSRDADLAQIRRAYKHLARHYHPDVGGTPTERFIEIQKAYETLKDAATRREHDQTLDQGAGLTPQRPSATPTSPRPRPYGWTEPPVGDMTQPYSVVDEFFGGFVPGMYNRGRMASRHKDLYVELILDREEAVHGGFFPLDVPVREICPRCGGLGFEGLGRCPHCDGGNVRYERITISVPPNVPSGTEKRLPLADIGLPDAHLVVLVTIEP
jgi:molecular chaperone DnaJ